jgi:hypothetical protein
MILASVSCQCIIVSRRILRVVATAIGSILGVHLVMMLKVWMAKSIFTKKRCRFYIGAAKRRWFLHRSAKMLQKSALYFYSTTNCVVYRTSQSQAGIHTRTYA